MAIILNDNLQINAGKPIDSRYLTTGNTAYASTGATNLAIPVPLRYTGLTVNILGVEYWYKNGVANIDLIEKKYDTLIPSGDFITGATNIGYFSGLTGVQILPITNLPDINYNGNYYSLYNYYYRGTDGNIHVGVPSDGIPKRGYVKTAAPVKSWLWNEYTGGGDLLGWVLVDGNISQEIGTFQGGYLYYPPATSYTESGWTTGNVYNNGSDLIISTVLGSLTTGTTITIGGPVYAQKVGDLLEFRTLQTTTPKTLNITNDEAFVYFSGATQITQGANVGTGAHVFKSLTGTTLQFRSIQGSGSTLVNQVGDNIIITTIVTGSTSGVTNAQNIGTGCGIFNAKVGNLLQLRSLAASGATSISSDGSTITISSCDTTAENIGTGCGIFTSKLGCCIQLKSLKGSGSTSISAVGSDLVIYSSGGSGGGTYNCASPSTCTVGGITAGTTLTGKTAFELFQEILAPELFGTLTNPSLGISISPSGTFEIGCSFATLCVTGTFSRGSISPQYCSASPFRSGTVNAYSFTGCQMPVGFQACVISPVTECATAYSVISGSQTWGVCARYCCGVQPKGSNGTNYNSPLTSGCTGTVSATITGILPWYWGKSASQVLVSADIAAGNKCLTNVTAAPLPIIYNSAPTDYLWFAVPACSGLKTCWYVNGINNGCIGGVGNLFATFCTVAVTSAQSCWAGCNYDVYVSCATTGTAVGVPMCMY